MKKSILFAAGFVALMMAFTSCSDDGGKTGGTGSDPVINPDVPEPIEGWDKVLKIDTDPASFSPGSQTKYQFKISGISFPANASISFYFIPCDDFTGQVCFRNCTDETEKWINGNVPTEVGESVTIGGTVTKVDDKWYLAEMKSVTAGTSIGFTFYKSALPVGDDVVYVKGFKIAGVDYETGAELEYEYTLDDFTQSEDNPNPCKIEEYYGVSGLRVTEVDSF